MAKAIVYLKAPISTGAVIYEAVAGDFGGDDVNVYTTTAFGGLIIPLANVAAVLGLADDYDMSTLASNVGLLLAN